MILVVGATGLLGGEICACLRERSVAVRALVRDESRGVERLRALGCEIARGDLKDAESLLAACRGAAGVVSTANSMLSRRAGDTLETVDRAGGLRLVAAARGAGVGRFVYTSISPVVPADNPFVRAKREVEQAVRSSGMAWTLLQPAAFMEVATGAVGGWDFKRGRARVVGTGAAPASYISVRDVAAFAVASLVHDRATDRALHLVGPEPISPVDAIRIAERVTGRTFRVQRAPRVVFAVAAVALAPFAPRLASLLKLICAGSRGETADMSAVLDDLPVRQTTFEEYVRRVSGAA